jgi:hypothetical protein
MIIDVDESRRNIAAGRIDHLLRRRRSEVSYADDNPLLQSDIGQKHRFPAPIDHRPVLNDYIVHMLQ